MFVRGMRGMRGVGDYIQRSPMFKIDDWYGQPIGGGLQTARMAPAASVIPGVSNTTAAAVGIGGLAAAAALAWYLLK